MAKKTKIFVNPATRPLTIARAITVALDNNKDVEIISMNNDAVARATEAMGLCNCTGKIEPADGDKVKISVDRPAV